MSELKDLLAAKTRAYEEAKRKLGELAGNAGGKGASLSQVSRCGGVGAGGVRASLGAGLGFKRGI